MMLSYWLMVIHCLGGSGGGMCQGTVNPAESAALFSSIQKGMDSGGVKTYFVELHTVT